MSAYSTIVGIDLGTTHSAVAYFDGGAVRVLPNALGQPLTPSVVALDERQGSLVVGRTAKDIYARKPQLGAALFKRDMGSEAKHAIAGARYGAVELSALVLRALRRDACDALHEDVRRCVITVPAYFNDAQRFATVKAGELAELEVVRILNEPTAAAIAHGAHRAATEGTLLVIDLGGGTFDVCVMDRYEGVLEVRSVAGESRLGGEDFTQALAGLALARAGVGVADAQRDPDALVTLLKRAELLKRRLSDEESGSIVVGPFPLLRRGPVELEIARPEAEEAFGPLLARLRGPCRGALRSAGLRRADVGEVILVGGATRMPCVREVFVSLLEREPMAGVDPDLAVVHGAAVQAALSADDRAVADMVVTDVASHSLGCLVSKKLGGRRISGFFSPVIHRNSVIPTSQNETFSTIQDNQESILFKIYEGESRYTKDNREIGTLLVEGIPRGPEGQEVDVRFTYDLNGILEVEATVAQTGKRISKIFTRTAASLSDADLAAAEERLARIKEDPRDKPWIRDALARAEALLTELPPVDRRRVERMLDALEAALVGRDASEIDGAGRMLVGLCDELDGGERW